VRLSLIDLLIWVAFAFFGFSIVQLIVPSERFPEYILLLFQCGTAVVTYVVGASFIYRRMLFWPLLSPICPHCRKRPHTFEITGTWPIFTISCGFCNGQTELRMHKMDNSDGDGKLLCLQLNWPYFLGCYKRIR
jgi:hypothetical protein